MACTAAWAVSAMNRLTASVTPTRSPIRCWRPPLFPPRNILGYRDTGMTIGRRIGNLARLSMPIVCSVGTSSRWLTSRLRVGR